MKVSDLFEENKYEHPRDVDPTRRGGNDNPKYSDDREHFKSPRQSGTIVNQDPNKPQITTGGKKRVVSDKDKAAQDKKNANFLKWQEENMPKKKPTKAQGDLKHLAAVLKHRKNKG